MMKAEISTTGGTGGLKVAMQRYVLPFIVVVVIVVVVVVRQRVNIMAGTARAVLCRLTPTTSLAISSLAA